MATVKVQHEGKEIEVTLPEGYLSPDEVSKKYIDRDSLRENYVLKAEFDRKFNNSVDRSKAAEDEQVIQAVLAKHKPKGESVDLEAAKQDWTKNELEPVRTKLASLKQRLTDASIREAAGKHFDDRFLNNPFASVESKYRDQFEYDDELGYAVEKAGEGRVAASNPSKQRPYADPEEFFARLARDPDYKDYVRQADAQKGSGYKGSNGNPGAVSKKRSEMSTKEKVAYINEHGEDAFRGLPQ